MPIPIIFIHHGNSDYLFYALWQTRKTNPQSRVILLGDRANVHYHWMLGVEHYLTNQYRQEAHDALKNYVHLSTVGEEFERFCIERWFILNQFLHSHPEISQCVYLDSDVLVYDSLDAPALDLAKFGMTMIDYSAHTNFIQRIEILSEFCSFIKQHYVDPSLRQWLHEHYTQYLAEVGFGGISDMTFFHKFRSENPNKVGTLVEPLGEGERLYAFDERLDTSCGGYKTNSEGLKQLEWKGQIPYCHHVDSQQDVKFFTLHFQGRSKQVMRRYLANPDLSFQYLFLWNNLRLLSGRATRLLARRVHQWKCL